MLALPLLFSGGMMLFDTLDGCFMNFAYGWAFARPVRKVFAAARQAQFDALADAIESSPDTDALLRLIEHGPPRSLPVLRTGI